MEVFTAIPKKDSKVVVVKIKNISEIAKSLNILTSSNDFLQHIDRDGKIVITIGPDYDLLGIEHHIDQNKFGISPAYIITDQLNPENEYDITLEVYTEKEFNDNFDMVE